MKFILQDITKVTGPAILCNGVNCQRAMGSGVAKSYFTKWPKVREYYMRYTKEDMHLGMIDPVLVEPNLYVMNMWTQEYYGRDHKVYASLDAIKLCFDKVFNFADSNGFNTVCTPRIGSGLGGLKWNDVAQVIDRSSFLFPHINVIVCDI